MSLTLRYGYDAPDEVGELFTEYTQTIIDGDSTFREYLAIQHYDEELLRLEEKYGLPDGRLYLADWDGQLSGCAALRRLDGTRCEMKRMYVRPAFRGLHIGQALVERLLADAREIGYRAMLLDTFPFLDRAIRLYRKYGFYEIERYNDSPMKTAIYLQKDLL